MTYIPFGVRFMVHCIQSVYGYSGFDRKSKLLLLLLLLFFYFFVFCCCFFFFFFFLGGGGGWGVGGGCTLCLLFHSLYMSFMYI